MSRLTLRYHPDPDDEVGELWLHLEIQHFSGSAFFWSNLAELPDLIEQMEQYPLKEAACEWGYDSTECHRPVMSLQIARKNTAGLLVVKVELADLNDPTLRLTGHFCTEYVLLQRFRSDLEAMLDRRSGEAVLGDL